MDYRMSGLYESSASSLYGATSALDAGTHDIYYFRLDSSMNKDWIKKVVIGSDVPIVLSDVGRTKVGTVSHLPSLATYEISGTYHIGALWLEQTTSNPYTGNNFKHIYLSDTSYPYYPVGLYQDEYNAVMYEFVMIYLQADSSGELFLRSVAGDIDNHVATLTEIRYTVPSDL
jgi:hypothetical protein